MRLWKNKLVLIYKKLHIAVYIVIFILLVLPLTGNISVDEYFKCNRFKCKDVKEFIFDERDLSNTGDGFRDICNSLCYFPNVNVIKIISYDLRGSRMQWFSEAIQNRYLIHLKSLIFESMQLKYIIYI